MTIYSPGSTGYPNARYGLAASGCVRRNTNNPSIVSA